MVSVKIRKVGNSLGVILPQEALSQLNVGEGDTLTFTESPEGWRLTAYDPEFEKELKLGEQIIRQYRNALRELAK